MLFVAFSAAFSPQTESVMYLLFLAVLVFSVEFNDECLFMKSLCFHKSKLQTHMLHPVRGSVIYTVMHFVFL